MLPFAHLHTHSAYSLLDGADMPQDLVRRAAELEVSAVALTDHDAVYGVIPFIKAAKKQGVQPIVGTEITLEGGYHLTLLVQNEIGWRNLCYLISCARHNASKGHAALPIAELQTHTQGLIALSGCRRGEISSAIRAKLYNDALAVAQRYLRWFGQGNFWIELQYHERSGEKGLIRDLAALGAYLNVGCVATNNVHYALPEKRQLQDVLVCIKNKTTIDSEKARRVRRPNGHYYLKSAQEMAVLFANYPEAITNTLLIAERCQFEPRYGLQDLPAYPTPDGQSTAQYLRYLCETALHERTWDNQQEAVDELDKQLGVIERAGLDNYLLWVGDIARESHRRGIFVQGRGAGCGSLPVHLLGISPINPLKHKLVSERFISDERGFMSDIDMDFQANRREEMIQYTYHRHGENHAAMASTFVTFLYLSAIRDVGKILGLPKQLLKDAALSVARGDEIPRTSEYTHQLATLCEQIDGLPRHLSIHNGAMIIMGSPISERIPTEPATMEDRVVVQWDKEMLEEVGIVKIDLLGLRALSAVEETVSLIEQETGQRPDLSQTSYDDPAVYQMICSSDTIGVFQAESEAQRTLGIPGVQPDTLELLKVANALIRPGPVQGNMVHPYFRRRAGLEPITYTHPLMEAALEQTMGLIIFQEDVIRVVCAIAGFTAGKGELVRRALSGKRPEREVEKLRAEFMAGARANDVTQDVAEQVFENLKAFGGYSFPESHAAAFATLVYKTAWLKLYWPVQFAVALLNNQPMGFWSPAVVANDARRHGIGLLRADINHSRGNCTVEGNSIRFGFRYVEGMGAKGIERIETAQQEGVFRNLRDFCRRVKLPEWLVERLILVGAFDEWGIERRKLLSELWAMHGNAGGLDLVSRNDVQFRSLNAVELFLWETQTMGVSTGEHIMTFFRDWMRKKHVLGSEQIQAVQHNTFVQVAGETVMHQSPPTAKGFHFITLEDREGMIRVIVRPRIYKQFRYALRHAPLLWIKGKLQREGRVSHVLCDQASFLPALTS